MTRNLTHMELRPAQVERINRFGLSRYQKALTPTQQCDRIIAWLGLGIALVIFAMLFLVAAEWSPGEQQRIAEEFKGLRHEGIAMGDWK